MQKFGGGWTQRKLDCVGGYLAAYTTALKNQPFGKRYIDAFAGTGYREVQSAGTDLLSVVADEEAVRFLEGSAVRSLQASPPFDEYIFIEKHHDKFAELQKLALDFPDRSVRPFHDDANEYLQRELSKMNWRDWRGVLFLDPFGTEVTWDTIEAIADTGAVDLWYLFPLTAVIRMLTRDGDLPDPWYRRLTLLFGTEEWYGVFYRKQSSDTLFGTDEMLTKCGDVSCIASYVLERLGSVFPAVAPNPLVLNNSGGTPLFLLCFAAATRNKKGQELALRIAGGSLQGKRRHG